MRYEELTEEQKTQLAGDYLVRLADEGVYAEVMGADHDAPSYGEMMEALKLVPEDVLEREYGGVVFGEDDFFQEEA